MKQRIKIQAMLQERSFVSACINTGYVAHDVYTTLHLGEEEE